MQWSSPDIERLAEAIREWTGLTFPAVRVRDVESTIEREMKRRGTARVPDFLRLLHDDAPVRDALVADLTIGETYFLRDPAQFALLRERVLPPLLARPADRPVRVWSAGCASGEEPYSIALLFDELDALSRAHIVGTDIARPRLVDAQRGIYGRWSLRGTSEAMRRRYFRERGRYYELTPRIRQHVDFRYLNLAEDRFPSLSIGIWGMDVILCRNVLIYFDRPTVERVARRLIASLSEDGWLMLGASDPVISELVDCDVVTTESGLLYRRPGAAGDGAGRRAVSGVAWPRGAGADVTFEPPAVQSVPPLADAADALEPVIETHEPASGGSEPAADAAESHDALPESAALTRDAHILEAYAERDFDRVVALAAAAADAELGAAAYIAWVRALANQGCLQQAADTAARAMRRHGPVAELVYLNAVLLLQTGSAQDAAALARRALYLDRTLVVAHMTLADAQRRTGRSDDARRALRNAAVLLEELPADEQVAASDGETAGRLRELVRVKLRLLSESA